MSLTKIMISLISVCWALNASAVLGFRASKEATVISGKTPQNTHIELLVEYQMIDPDNQLCYRLPEQINMTFEAQTSETGQYQLEMPLKAFNEDCAYSYHSAQYHISGPSIEEYILLESSESLKKQIKLLSANFKIPEISMLKNIVCEFNAEELGLCEVEGALPDSYLISAQTATIEIHVLNSGEIEMPEN